MSRSHSALIVDADPKGLEVLVYGFQEGGWSVTVCPLLETVPFLIKASGAQILILSSRDDHEKALALLQQLRGSEAAHSLAFLLLAPEKIQSQVRLMEDVDFLAMPTYMADILCASTIIVGTRALWNRRSPGENTIIEIPIPPHGPLSFIRTVCGLGRSGIATLEHSGKHGEIWFHEGEVTAAQFGSLQGVSAAHHMLLWEKGWIRLHIRSVARRGQLRQTSAQFLEEAERFIRDFKHYLKALGPRTAVFKTDEARLAQIAANVPAEVMPVMRLCDGKRNLSDLLDDSPFRVLDTFGVIARMLEVAALTRSDPQPTPTPTPIPTVDIFWETARVTKDSGAAPTEEVQNPEYTPTPDPHAISLGIDRRSSSSSQTRRRVRRQPGKPTPSHGTPTEITPRVETGTQPASSKIAEVPKAAIPAATPAPVTKTIQRTSGTIELQTSDRRARANHPISKERVSIVVTLPEVTQKKPDPAPVSISPVKVLATSAPASATNAAPAEKPTPTSTRTVSAEGRLAGIMEVAGKKRVTPAAAARPSAGSSIQLDASLLTEKPARAPTPQGNPTPAKRPATIPPATSSVPVPAPVEKSNAHGTAVSHRASTSQPGHVPTPNKGTAPSRSVTRPDGSNVPPPAAPVEAPTAERSKSRISGAFDAVESDFFAREADLYKEESVDSFADLEDKNSKSKLAGNRKRK